MKCCQMGKKKERIHLIMAGREEKKRSHEFAESIHSPNSWDPEAFLSKLKSNRVKGSYVKIKFSKVHGFPYCEAGMWKNPHYEWKHGIKLAGNSNKKDN